MVQSKGTVFHMLFLASIIPIYHSFKISAHNYIFLRTPKQSLALAIRFRAIDSSNERSIGISQHKSVVRSSMSSESENKNNDDDNNDDYDDDVNVNLRTRRFFFNEICKKSFLLLSGPMTVMPVVAAIEQLPETMEQQQEQQAAVEVLVSLTGDAKKMFNEGRALETQGSIAKAQRLYYKVTKMSPGFIYGWSNLGNTQVILGELDTADKSYTKSIEMCIENNRLQEEKPGVNSRCTDIYLFYLNRGALRLNNNMPKEALDDLEKADLFRAQPDAIVLQNRARARELNGLYDAADRDYTVAISMTSSEVNPFWLRAALVKFQIGDFGGFRDLTRRVSVELV